VSDITGSELKKRVNTFTVKSALLRGSMTADCLQTSFVKKSW